MTFAKSPKILVPATTGTKETPTFTTDPTPKHPNDSLRHQDTAEFGEKKAHAPDTFGTKITDNIHQYAKGKSSLSPFKRHTKVQVSKGGRTPMPIMSGKHSLVGTARPTDHLKDFAASTTVNSVDVSPLGKMTPSVTPQD